MSLSVSDIYSKTPILLKTAKNSETVSPALANAPVIVEMNPSMSMLSKNAPSLSARLSKLILSKASETAFTALIPNLLSFSKAGMSLLERLSLAPSMAWSTVLNSVAIFWKASEFPARLSASKKSSVLSFPSWTAFTRSAVDIPISFATAAIPAGACSIMILKSIQAILGLLAICVA